MKKFVFSVFTSKHKSCLIHSSKRDTHKQISRCSLKTWSRAGYKLSTDLSRVTPEQKTVLRV